MATNIPQPTFGPAGFVPPAESAVLAGATADINAALGGGLNPALTTPQGQLASSYAAEVGNGNDQFVALANGVDPANATGRMQDGIGRIYFMTRNPPQSTVVQVLCTGLTNTPLPVGSLIQANDGNLYSSTQAATIPISGSILVPFACTVTGPIACLPQTFTIYQTIPGWDIAASSVAGSIGNVVESPSAFEIRRAATVEANSQGYVASIRGAVLNVPNLLSAYVTENSTGSPLVIGGVTVPANSLYVTALGGTAAAIGAAIWSKKPPGASYYGGTAVTVYDTSPPYPAPGIPYTVSFDWQTPLPFVVNVQIVNSSLVPANALALIQGAIQAAFSGADGGYRQQAGFKVTSGRFYAGIAALGAWANVLAIEMGSTNAPAATWTGSIAGNTMTIVAGGTGTLAVGQTLFGVGIVDGTTITALGTGSGGAGTYTVSNTQAVASTSIQAVSATLFSVLPNINQAPTVTAADITLTLV